jgi:hypothetical protein
MVPGSYTFREQAGEHTFVFTIGSDGLISYGAPVSAFATGAGTNTLNVDGFETTVTSNLSSQWDVDYVIPPWQPAGATRVARTLPGAYVFREQAGEPTFAFTVGGDGLISFDPSLSAYVSGSGTNTLVVDGFEISVTSNLAAQWDVDQLIPPWQPVGATRIARTLPGLLVFREQSVEATFVFRVDTGGLIQDAPALFESLPVSGNGTTALVVGL